MNDTIPQVDTVTIEDDGSNQEQQIFFDSGDLHARGVVLASGTDESESYRNKLVTDVASHTPESNVIIPDGLEMNYADLSPQQFASEVVNYRSQLSDSPTGPVVEVYAEARYDDVTQLSLDMVDAPGLHSPTMGPSSERMIDVGVGLGLDIEITPQLVMGQSYIVVAPQ